MREFICIWPMPNRGISRASARIQINSATIPLEQSINIVHTIFNRSNCNQTARTGTTTEFTRRRKRNEERLVVSVLFSSRADGQ